MLGLDLGGRFATRRDLRPRGDDPCSAGRRARRRRRRGACSRRSTSSRARSSTRPGATKDLIDGVVVGVPGVVDAGAAHDLASRRASPGLEGERRFATELAATPRPRRDARQRRQPRRARGAVARRRPRCRRLRLPLDRHRPRASGSCSAASSTVAATGRRESSTTPLPGFGRASTPARRASPRTQPARRARRAATDDPDARPTSRATSLRPRARGDALAADVVHEVARRIALHIVPVAAVTDVGARRSRRRASARTATCCSSRCAPLSPAGSPIHRRVEISSLGEAAVLSGALALGLRDALDDVVERRPPAVRD